MGLSHELPPGSRMRASGSYHLNGTVFIMSSGAEILVQANQSRQEKRYRESLALYDVLLQAEPENREALIGKGWALLHEGEKTDDAGYVEALGYFQAALNGNESNVVMLRKYARALIETGAIRHWETASRVCDQILVLAPNDLQALLGKARVLCWLGRNEESLVLCDWIIEIDAEAGKVGIAGVGLCTL